MTRTVLAMVLAFPMSSIAQDACGPPPTGQGGDWFRAYQKWCKACGGTPSEYADPGTCKPGPNWRGPANSTGGSGSSLIEQSISYGAKSGDVEGALLGMGVGILVDGLFSPTDPQAAHKRSEDARQQELLRAQAQERKREAQKRRIVSQLKGSESLVPLSPETGDANPLGLKLGDDAAYVARAPAARIPPAPPAPANLTAPTQQGMRDATGCFEPRPGLFCMNAPNRAECERNYNSGFANGLIAVNNRLDAARAAGRDAKRRGDTTPHTEIFAEVPWEDTCKVKLINAYSGGYAGP